MFARTTKFQLKPGAMTEFMHAFNNTILPTLQRQSGFRAITLLTDETTDKVLGITQWATEADLFVMQTNDVNQSLLGALRPLVTEPPVQESYSVSLQAEPI